MFSNIEMRDMLSELRRRVINRSMITSLRAGSLGHIVGDDDDPISADALYPRWEKFFRPGDTILTVEGRPLSKPDDIRKLEAAKPGQPLTMTVRHEKGGTFTTAVKPVYSPQDNRYLIGISTGVFTPLNAVESGALFPFAATKVLVHGMYQLVTGQIPGGFFGQNGATGVVGFGYFTYQAAAQGLITWLTLVAFLSMALGLTNLLPLPALDGGRIVVVLLEKVRGRPFDRKREEAVQRAGLVALLALMALIAFFDVQRIATGQFPGIK